VVTHRAERDTRKWINRIKRINPDAKIIITGCFPFYEKIEDDNILFQGSPGEVIEYLKLENPQYLRFPLYHVRANVKVQEGCNFRCSYCIVPKTRGKSRSRPWEEILLEVDGLVKNGVSEIVITGTQTGEWGKEWEMHLADLLEEIIARFPGVRIRLSSISPIHIDERIIELLEEEKILPHLHLPIQSGSPRILRMMRRPYTLDKYLDLMEKLFLRVPDIAVGTDVIVGFPGETDEDFQTTVETLKKIPFAYMHVFEFSRRPGTEAYQMEPVSSHIIRSRKDILLEIAREKKVKYIEKFLGKHQDGVVEKKSDGWYHATTGNYLKLIVQDRYKFETGRVYKFLLVKMNSDFQVEAIPSR